MRHTNNQEVPNHFARCFNSRCSNAANCLRHHANIIMPSNDAFVFTINPALYPINDGSSCNMFVSVQKMRVAWGVKHLFDTMPNLTARRLKSSVISYFGKVKYYRFYREEKYLTPEEQNAIRQLFLQEGITEEPTFTSYSEEYRW